MAETDKRKKLTDDQKDEIRQIMDTNPKLGDRKIAEQYGVSRRTIQFMRDPAKLVANRELAKIRKKLS